MRRSELVDTLRFESEVRLINLRVHSVQQPAGASGYHTIVAEVEQI